jgi:transcriptional regulator with XRE-family HTH domain
MTYGLPWSDQFVQQLADKEVRSEFAADQIRARIAALIRALRDDPDRGWTQSELGQRTGKTQNVISRFESADYGKMSLQSLFKIADAFDLPVWIDMPEWEEWLHLIKDVPNRNTRRSAFDLKRLRSLMDMESVAGVEPISYPTSGAAAAAIHSMLLGQDQIGVRQGAALNANVSQSASQNSLSTSIEKTIQQVSAAA